MPNRKPGLGDAKPCAPAASFRPTLQFWNLKRRLLADHFFDTVLLLAFECGIVFAFAFLGRFVQMEAELISWVHLVTTWTCISTLMLFSIQFLVLFAITSLNDIKEIAVQHDGNRITPEERV